jgi:hypothetical protein
MNMIIDREVIKVLQIASPFNLDQKRQFMAGWNNPELLNESVLPPNSSSGFAPRYILRDAKHALEPQLPTEFLVSSIIVQSALAIFVGDAGVGKTWILLHMAVCVAAGKYWCGFSCKQTPVLIIDEESGETRFSRRLGEVLRG